MLSKLLDEFFLWLQPLFMIISVIFVIDLMCYAIINTKT